MSRSYFSILMMLILLVVRKTASWLLKVFKRLHHRSACDVM